MRVEEGWLRGRDEGEYGRRDLPGKKVYYNKIYSVSLLHGVGVFKSMADDLFLWKCITVSLAGVGDTFL